MSKNSSPSCSLNLPSLALKKNLEFSDKILRGVSLAISAVLLRTPITPNQVTLISFLCALFAGYLFLKGDYHSLVLGGVFAFFRQILDQVDGEIARVKKLSSSLGKWFDGITGFLSTEIILLGLTFGIDTPAAYRLGFLAALAYPLQYLFIYFYKGEVTKSSEKISLGTSRLEVFRYLYGSAFFYLFVPFCVFLNKPFWVLTFFAIFGNLYWMGILLLQYLELQKKSELRKKSPAHHSAYL